MGGELDHADHQRDAGRVVDAGLALQRGARAPADLAPAQHREDDGGVGRRQRRADDAGELPVHPQQPVRGAGEHGRGDEGARDPERHDRPGRRPEAPPAGVHAAVEQHDDERDDGDALDRSHRDVLAQNRPHIGRHRGGDQEDRRRRDGPMVAQLRRENRERERARDNQDDEGEVGELGHGNTAPTRLPGSPRRTLPTALSPSGRSARSSIAPRRLGAPARSMHETGARIADRPSGFLDRLRSASFAMRLPCKRLGGSNSSVPMAIDCRKRLEPHRSDAPPRAISSRRARRRSPGRPRTHRWRPARRRRRPSSRRPSGRRRRSRRGSARRG